MKTHKFKSISVTTVLILFLASFNISSAFADKKETRKVGGFNQISLSIPANLYLTQGAKNEVIIEAGESVLEKIETEVDGSRLYIKFEKWYNYKGLGSINIYITVKEIEGLSVAGSGDIITKSAIKTEGIDFNISGSGSIKINDLTTREITAMITGSGDVKVQGKSKAKELDVTVTGSGDFESQNIEFDEAELTITGSGSIYTFVTGELEAVITGSGKIYYKGQPLVNANITGSGKIKSDN
jgi:hypothetical protein